MQILASLVENLNWLQQNDQFPGNKCFHYHNGNANPSLELRDDTDQIYCISSGSKCFQSRFICEADRTIIAEVVDAGFRVDPSVLPISINCLLGKLANIFFTLALTDKKQHGYHSKPNTRQSQE